MDFLRVENLSIIVGDFHLNNISLNLRKGDYLAIVGPTGAGKTVLLETIVGFHRPVSGKIELEGKNITELDTEERNIGIVYQDYALFPHMSVSSNIAYGLKKKPNPTYSVKEMARMFHIDHLLDRKPESLSGGEKQRVALARALIVEPKLILMDEPFSALDHQTKSMARQIIRKAINNIHMTVIHVTHDMEDVWSLANRIAIIDHGRILQSGTTREVAYTPNSQFVASFVGTFLFDGTVKQIKKLTSVEVKGVEFLSHDTVIKEKTVNVAIRPENIFLFGRKPMKSEYRLNAVEVKVKDIIPQGHEFLITFAREPFSVDLCVPKYTMYYLDIDIGKSIYLSVKPEHVKIVEKHSQTTCAT